MTYAIPFASKKQYLPESYSTQQLRTAIRTAHAVANDWQRTVYIVYANEAPTELFIKLSLDLKDFQNRPLTLVETIQPE
jgi:hypothetical protein